MSELKTYTIGQVTLNYDSRRVPVQASERRSGPYPYYGASGIVDSVDSYLFDGDYLLIAEDGENLRTRRTPVAFIASGRFWVNNHAHVVQGNHLADSRYLAYALARTDISGYLSGSTQPKLTQAAMNRIEIPLPERAYQESVVAVLRALDDKIAVNDRIVLSVEKLCGSIFCDFFSEALEFLKRGGRLPAGWTAGVMGDVCSVLETGRRPKGGVSRYADGVPSIGAESISRLGEFDFTKVKYVPDRFFSGMRQGIIEDYDILLYKDGGRPGNFEPHVSMFGQGFPFERMCINEHVYRIRLANPLGQAYGYFWLSSEPVMAEMRSRGTGVAIPGLNSSAVKQLPVVCPAIDRLTRFNQTALPMIDRALSGASESRTLGQLRDTLLPKLMSGAIQVQDAEKFVEDVT